MELAVIRTIVCDDEQEARDGIVIQLRRDPAVSVVATARDGLESMRAITSLAPDLVLLDVEMPVMNGFEVLARAGLREPPVVVFITAHERFALEAFNVHAQDYLLKPFSDARFSDMLTRAKVTVRQRRAHALSETLTAVLSGARR
jgi:two-component system LytT family response regulator